MATFNHFWQGPFENVSNDCQKKIRLAPAYLDSQIKETNGDAGGGKMRQSGGEVWEIGKRRRRGEGGERIECMYLKGDALAVNWIRGYRSE